MGQAKEEALQVRDALRAFILRVAAGKFSSAEEFTVLPQIVQLYLDRFSRG